MGLYKLSAPGTFKDSRVTYKSLLMGNPVANPDKGSMYPIGIFTLSSSQTTVEFTNIPQTYTHLQLRWTCRTSAAGTESWQSIRFNGNTSGYANHILYGTGSGNALSTNELLGNRINYGTTAGNGASSSTFGSGIIEILDYKNSFKNKTLRFLDGYDNNGSGMIAFRSGLWANTAPITSILIGPENFSGTVSYLANSTFALYGVNA